MKLHRYEDSFLMQVWFMDGTDPGNAKRRNAVAYDFMLDAAGTGGSAAYTSTYIHNT